MPKLFVVPTPIGNLEDMTFRAVRLLKEADLILAEDTRITGKLLKHYDIETKMLAYHKFNEHKAVDKLVGMIQQETKTALVSDAGTPSISDPGYLLINRCIDQGIEVECLPGATALIPALVNSGLPCDRFYFEGFIPLKKGRRVRLEQLANHRQSVVIYESPHRLLKTLKQLAEKCGSERKACVSRELTKIYEENIRGKLSDMIRNFELNNKIKGECVIVLEGKSD